jgi:hypothetical protein
VRGVAKTSLNAFLVSYVKFKLPGKHRAFLMPALQCGTPVLHPAGRDEGKPIEK